MSIEIRQMVVNANVQKEDSTTQTHIENGFDSKQLKAEIMEACNDLIRQLLRQKKER